MCYPNMLPSLYDWLIGSLLSTYSGPRAGLQRHSRDPHKVLPEGSLKIPSPLTEVKQGFGKAQVSDWPPCLPLSLG